VCSKNEIVWHRFPDITTFAAHVIACNLENSFRFNMTVEIIGPIFSSTHRSYTVGVIYAEVWELGGFQAAKSDPQDHSRSLLLMPFDKPHMMYDESFTVTVSLSCTVSKISSFISYVISPKLKRSRDHEHSPYTEVVYRACAQRRRLKCRPGDGPRPGSYFEVPYSCSLRRLLWMAK